MKPMYHTSLTVLVLLLATATAPAADIKNAATKTSIPAIARIGKLQIGHATQEDLARHWGEGRTIIGGHANSGRLWRVKSTSWILQTDGFEYSKQGLVVDSFTVYVNPKRFSGPELLSDVPFTHPAKSEFAWGGEIWPGMSKGKVMKILKRKAWRPTPTQDGCEISAQGFYALQSNTDPLRTWTARLVFTNGSLSQLTLAAGFK